MKRVLFLLTVFLTSLNVFSQEHMMFNGIHIDGKVEELVHKLELKGYKLDTYLDGHAIMTGTFAGKSATLYILGTVRTKTAWKISVNFGESNSWYSLKGEYNDFKELYTKKYGRPESHYEFFSDPYYEGDGYELQALRLNKCHYLTIYDLDTGSIAINLSSSESLTLSYEDKINRVLKTQEETNQALDDI